MAQYRHAAAVGRVTLNTPFHLLVLNEIITFHATEDDKTHSCQYEVPSLNYARTVTTAHAVWA